jgi:hypothetical protein
MIGEIYGLTARKSILPPSASSGVVRALRTVLRLERALDGQTRVIPTRITCPDGCTPA